MDYRNILATGFLLLCGAVFVHSLKSANAFPQGPNVSMGSNPVDFASENCSGGNITLFTNTSSQPFIMTDIQLQRPEASQYIRLNGAKIFATNYGYTSIYNYDTGIKVEPGDVLTCGGYHMTITGYYAHP